MLRLLLWLLHSILALCRSNSDDLAGGMTFFRARIGRGPLFLVHSSALSARRAMIRCCTVVTMACPKTNRGKALDVTTWPLGRALSSLRAVIGTAVETLSLSSRARPFVASG